ncbi:outer membrane protein OmpU [Meinhardsimonia xiamenensis]|jgi:outer membrane protein OmpU|uniref:Outer membrane protein OmpU n=1 Tax=Meinhardsimonia xiamenensis TaxID=990712 RepID=A0A1G9E7M7_9RHOB|nr:porin [Meinhardsimonia xiamenensis]PRX33894.1 outer membrane protein OmpU [Meinhardsimonia xiamenensis]SDK72108.1 outer membrane protein OmpU [Meinhardsimonia xiamenensis]
MKKVLFATTALVASAGFASAEIALSGSGEIGVFGGDALAGAPYTGNLQFHTDVDVTFKMSGQTDGGIEFGAVVDLDENSAFDPETQGGEYLYVKGAFGTLTMGDTDGAYDFALTEVNLAGGSLMDDETEHGGFNGNAGLDGLLGLGDGQIARYDYAFGDFAFALSVELDDTGVSYDPIFGVGAKYSASMGDMTVGFGIGYQTVSYPGGDTSIIGASVNADFGNGFQAAVNYSDLSSTPTSPLDYTHWGVGVAYEMDAWTFAANYGTYDRVLVGADAEGFGVVVNYDLGGGAVIQAGYGNTSPEVGTSYDTYSFGLSMSF